MKWIVCVANPTSVQMEEKMLILYVDKFKDGGNSVVNTVSEFPERFTCFPFSKESEFAKTLKRRR